MSEENIRSDMLYHVSLSIAKTMLKQGIITEREYTAMDKFLLKKYQPYLGKLMSKNA